MQGGAIITTRFQTDEGIRLHRDLIGRRRWIMADETKGITRALAEFVAGADAAGVPDASGQASDPA